MTDIIIVGAGIAGLSAGNYLKQQGFNPIILEAQAEVGGRVKTDRSLGIAFDEGASWIHGPVKNPISMLAKKAGMKTFLTRDDNVKIYDVDGTEYDYESLIQTENFYYEVLDKLEGKEDKSFADIFYQSYPHYRQDRLMTFLLSADLEFDTGGDIYKLASTNLYDDRYFRFNGKDVIVTNGYDTIANYLAQDLDIRLHTQVTGIDYSTEKISILTDGDNYLADRVLLSVPLGVLQKGKIKFMPELPVATQKAINELGMGTVNKFLLVWDHIFWEEDLQYIGYTPAEKGKFNYFLNLKNYTDTPALMTFSYGDYALVTEQMTDREIIAEVMAHLKHIYGSDIPAPKHMLSTQWHANPYSYGSYSYPAPGLGSGAYKIFEQAVDNKIFFAGEHTIFEYRATVHGAYLSGIREAKKMLSMV